MHMKLALAACAVASTSVPANAVQTPLKSGMSSVSTCYYVGSYITEDGIYDVYRCYSNGDGTY